MIRVRARANAFNRLISTVKTKPQNKLNHEAHEEHEEKNKIFSFVLFVCFVVKYNSLDPLELLMRTPWGQD